MKAQVTRCDICGHDDSPDNRVSVRVIGIDPETPPAEKSERWWPFVAVRPSQVEDEGLDLCQRCGGGFVAILRARHERRVATQRELERVQPANQVPPDADRDFRARMREIASEMFRRGL